MYLHLWFLFCTILNIIEGAEASTWAIFKDSACAQSVNTVPGENGYPDGVCTSIPETAVQYGAYKSFMFITLDEGCTATIYQDDTNSLTCSGYAKAAAISTCYNTSWAYYSIDQCTKGVSSSSSTTTSTPTPSASHASSSTTGSITGGAIAAAIVVSVCGLGIIVAVCVFFFWFRPRQQAKREREEEEFQMLAAATRNAEEAQKKKDDALREEQARPSEMEQRPAELMSPNRAWELANNSVSYAYEAPGDKGGFELTSESQPVELPGDDGFTKSSRGYERGYRKDWRNT